MVSAAKTTSEARPIRLGMVGGGNDAFVHISAVERSGMATLNQDQRVSYDLEEDRRGKMAAVNIQHAE